jgi:hypothetical protein
MNYILITLKYEERRKKEARGREVRETRNDARHQGNKWRKIPHSPSL